MIHVEIRSACVRHIELIESHGLYDVCEDSLALVASQKTLDEVRNKFD